MVTYAKVMTKATATAVSHKTAQEPDGLWVIACNASVVWVLNRLLFFSNGRV